MKLYTPKAVARETGDDTVLLVCADDALFYRGYAVLAALTVHEDVEDDERLAYVRAHLGDLPPIIVIDEGTVVDGAHRVTVARAQGRETLPAFIAIEEVVR